MKKLDMIKAFAKLEGVKISIMGSVAYVQSNAEVYDPFDYALNCKARDDYKVEIDYLGFASINFVTSKMISKERACVRFDSKEEVRGAVIECILKSEGVYDSGN